MKRNFLLGLTAAALIGIHAPARADEFVMPTPEQIQKIAETPELLRDILKDANEDQSVALLLDIISKVDGLDITLALKQEKVSALFSITADVKGAAAQTIIARVVKRVQPRLLPIVRTGSPGANAFAPTTPRTAPPYDGQ